MADGDHAMSSIEVEVLVSFFVIDLASPSLDQGYVIQGIYVKQFHLCLFPMQ